MADNLRKYTTQEVLNKVYTDSSGNSIGLNAATSKETLNAVLTSGADSLNVALSGGTISGDVTISGDLTVEGGGSLAFDEIVEGTMALTVNNSNSDPHFQINNANAGGRSHMLFQNTSRATYWAFGQDSDNDLKFANHVHFGSNVRMTLATSGNLGLGTDSPGSLLDLSHSTGSTTKSMNLTRTVTGNTSATNRAILFDINKTSTMDASATLNYDAMHIDFDDSGADNAASTVNLTGLKVDVNSDDATGTTKNVGLNVSVGGADTNYAAIFDGGYVGIGGDPTTTLDVNDNGIQLVGNLNYTVLARHSSMSRGIALGHDGGGSAGFISAYGASNDLIFATHNGTAYGERMRLDHDGKVLIGTSTAETLWDFAPQFQIEGTDAATSSMSAFRNSNDASGAMVVLGSSRGGAVNADTVVQDDDVLGRMVFVGADGSDRSPVGAIIESAVDGTPGSNDLPSRLVFSTTADGAATATERMRIDSSGDIYFDGTDGMGFKNISSDGMEIWCTNYSRFKIENHGGTWHFRANTSTGPSMLSDTSSTTKAVFRTHGYTDNDGVGGGDGQVALITDGASRLIVDDNSRISLSNNLDLNTGNTVFGKSAWNIASTTTNNASDYNVAIGELAMGTGTIAGATYNTALGYKAMEDVTDGDANVAVGSFAGANITTGVSNVAIGAYDGTNYGALHLNAAGSYSIGIGTGALAQINENDNDGSIAIGHKAGYRKAGTGGDQYSKVDILMGYASGAQLTTGANNTAIGHSTMGGDVTGTALTGSNNTVLGYNAGYDMEGASSSNTLIGGQSGLDLSTSSYNTFVGAMSGYEATTNEGNVFLGYQAGKNTAGNYHYNVAIGMQALLSAHTQSGTVAIGYKSLTALTSGGSNTAIGSNSGLALTTGGNNVAIGYDSFKAAVDACNSNIAIGVQAMTSVDRGSHADALVNGNIALGYNALAGGDFGSSDKDLVGNIAIGKNTLDATGANAQTGTIAIGQEALTALTSGAGNTAVGYKSGFAMTTGSANTFLGYQAGLDSDTGAATAENSVFVGWNAGAHIDDGTDNIAIGASALVSSDVDGQNASYNVAIGSFALGSMHDGDNNVAIGHWAGRYNGHEGGDNNVFVGFKAGINGETDDPNGNYAANCVAVGALSMGGNSGSTVANISGANNTCVGYDSGGQIEGAGHSNTYIGQSAGNTGTTGYQNTCVGKDADVSASGTNQTAIGYNAVATQNYETRLGMNGALRWLTWQGTMSTFTNVGDNIAAAAAIHEFPRYGFLKRITCTVLTASGGTGEYNISLGGNVEAAGDAVSPRTELIGAGSGTQTGAKVRSSLKTADADGLADIVTAKHTFVWEADQTVDDSVGWTLLESGNMYLYICHANGSNASNATNAILRVTAEYYGED